MSEILKAISVWFGITIRKSKKYTCLEKGKFLSVTDLNAS